MGGLNTMTKILETTNKMRMVSKTHSKSLILPVPATVRDIMQFKHGTQITWEICLNGDEKYIKLSEKKD